MLTRRQKNHFPRIIYSCVEVSQLIAIYVQYYEYIKRLNLKYIILIFDIKENEWTYNRQLVYQQIYIMNV